MKYSISLFVSGMFGFGAVVNFSPFEVNTIREGMPVLWENTSHKRFGNIIANKYSR